MAGTVVVILVLAVVIFFAGRATIKHSKGEGGCCGGGGTVSAETKKLDGDVTAVKIIEIEGMHCENCKNSVERSINKIDGAVGKVNLKKNICEVSMDRDISDEALRIAVERLDFHVKKIYGGELEKCSSTQ